MQHVKLDAQPDAIRKFVLALAVPPDGTLLELHGRPVACLVPAPSSTNAVAEDEQEWTDAMNRRRCKLIDRKYETGLTPTEEVELATLQAGMDRHVDKVAPLPLEAARKLHQQLLDKATKGHAHPNA